MTEKRDFASVVDNAFGRYRTIIDDWDAFVHALESPLPYCFRTNTQRIDVATLQSWYEQQHITVQPIDWYPGAFRFTPPIPEAPGRLLPHKAGWCHIQEEASLLPVYLLRPQAGERVLDCCAAPGGKTAQMALSMKNQGTIIANDRSTKRMRALRSILERLGILNVAATAYDASRLPQDINHFDRILCDAPCSCEGTSRKNRSHLTRKKPTAYREWARVQQAILQRACALLKPGGTLVYSSCTYAPY